MKKLEKSQRKKFRNEHKELVDELLPKATGRERLLEKKFIRKEEARQREESPELLREQDIMGGSDDFKQRSYQFCVHACICKQKNCFSSSYCILLIEGLKQWGKNQEMA